MAEETCLPKTFDDLNISEKTKAAIQAWGFTDLTPIQQKAIPAILAGNDVLGQAKTGSGKTLAFVIPTIEGMVRVGFKHRNGAAVIIVTPVRELALQIQAVVRHILNHHKCHYTMQCLTGGMKTAQLQAQKLEIGANVIVATPGRLLDHLHNTSFVYNNLLSLVFDEADRLLDEGFAEPLEIILSFLPKQRQTLMFSATITAKVDKLAAVGFAKPPVFIGIKAPKATNQELQQGYVVVPLEHRLCLLYAFLLRNQTKRVLVFLSTCKEVKFYHDLLNYLDLPCTSLHGDMTQPTRTTVFWQYSNAPAGVLLCTDVASRGLDFPAVDWILQFDPPESPEVYIHRVGRTARAGQSGSAILFLLPSEKPYVRILQKKKIPLTEYKLATESALQTGKEAEDRAIALVASNQQIRMAAEQAFTAYLWAYARLRYANAFNLQALDLDVLAKQFALPHAPAKVKYDRIGLEPPASAVAKAAEAAEARRKRHRTDIEPFAAEPRRVRRATERVF